MNEPIDELITYADHTQGCMVAAGHDECTCGYDDAEGKAQAAWDALKAENAGLAAECAHYRQALSNMSKIAKRYLYDLDDAYQFAILADAALSAVPSDSPAGVKSEPHLETTMSNVTDEMVNRFLGWKLPRDFMPDAGIAFTAPKHPGHWPIGTNLLTAEQARAMLEHVLSASDQPSAGPLEKGHE